MITTDIKKTLKWRCRMALRLIDAMIKINDSVVVAGVLRSAREETEALQTELLNNSDLTDEEVREMAFNITERLDVLGKDLIAYGSLATPSDNKN